MFTYPTNSCWINLSWSLRLTARGPRSHITDHRDILDTLDLLPRVEHITKVGGGGARTGRNRRLRTDGCKSNHVFVTATASRPSGPVWELPDSVRVRPSQGGSGLRLPTKSGSLDSPSWGATVFSNALIFGRHGGLDLKSTRLYYWVSGFAIWVGSWLFVTGRVGILFVGCLGRVSGRACSGAWVF